MGGTGAKFTYATTVVAGVASLIATLMSMVSIWLQAKNYRKPLQQRYVIRILMMVPIYAIASWTSMISHTAAAFLDPIRDIYEAFTIYTFFQLMVGYIGGERSLIIMMHGRAPVNHLWPMDHVLPKVDISDPHTFLAIKRGILQYTWLKPVLSLATIIMRACGVYREGYIGLNSGYLWSGIIYNISVSLSLYSLGLFWVCMHDDLKPFRPVPKFLCVKLIIFASYWQGFLLSILVWIGAIPDQVEGYTPDNLAAAIQDALICIEMPLFAAYHWHAFSWRDFYVMNIQSARMTVSHAFKDSFGARDLIEDSKMTLRGDNYGYRVFDSGDKIMAHEDSKSRIARLKDGMRYERGGKGKYWIRKPGDPANNPTPFVPTMPGDAANAAANGNTSPDASSSTPLLGGSGASSSRQNLGADHGTFDEAHLDTDEESLYAKARELEFGDWNYPVVSPSASLYERYMSPRGSQGGLSPASPFTRASQLTPQRDSSRNSPRPQVSREHHTSSSSSSGSRAASNTPKTQPTISPPPPEPIHDQVTVPDQEAQERVPLSQQAQDDDTSSDDEETSERAPLYRISDDEEAQNVWG